MKLPTAIHHLYRGLSDEEVPKNVTHMTVDGAVTTIGARAFHKRSQLISVIMGDSVTTIEQLVFFRCSALSILKLSKTLKTIETNAFTMYNSLEAVFLPSTVESIETFAFCGCPDSTKCHRCQKRWSIDRACVDSFSDCF